MKEGLTHLINSFGFTNEEENELILSKFEVREFQKGEYLVEEGKVCTELGFITNGFFRVYVLDENIDEKTIHITGDNDFIAAFSSFISREKSFEFVQALTDAQALVVSKDDLEGLYDSSPNIERLGRRIVESLFVRKENRVIDFIKYSAQERYSNLMDRYPEMLNNVPLHYIASYLGVKPETLSRIRAKTI